MGQVGIFGSYQIFYAEPSPNLRTTSNFEDFICYDAGNTQGIYSMLNGGVGAGCNLRPGEAARPGQVLFDTGTTAAGYAYLLAFGAGANVAALFGAGVWTWEGEIYIPTLSTAAEEFQLRFGWGDSAGADHTDGVYFQYLRTTSVNWLCCCANNSVRTKTDSGVAVAAASWLKLKIIVNAAGTAAMFYVNGTLVATVTTNIPTAAGRESALLQIILKSVGVTNRTFIMDWSFVRFDLTASR